MKYLMGIDNGGTFVKAGIIDETGNLVAVSREPIHNQTPKPGFTERDMDALWEQNSKVVRAALEKSGLNPSDIAGVSFSGHGKGLYLVGADGRPAYPGILSTDTRAWEYPKKWKEDGTAEKVYKKTYQDILACQPVSLLAWLKDHEPKVYGNIRYCMTGEAGGEYTNFSGANLVNLNTAAYDRELLGYFGLEDLYDKLPPLKFSADICGRVTKEAAALTGLAAGTPVMAGMFDVDACGIASGIYFFDFNKQHFSKSQKDNAVVFTSINSLKVLKRSLKGVDFADYNVVIDTLNRYTVDFKENIYPLIVYLDKGKIVKVDMQSPETDGLSYLQQQLEEKYVDVEE